MKKTITTYLTNRGLLLVVSIGLISSAQGAIAFLPFTNTNTGANESVVYYGSDTFRAGTGFDGVTTMGTFEGITMTMVADVAGSWDGNLGFTTSSQINAGTSVCFTGTANMLLMGGQRADFPDPWVRNRTAISVQLGSVSGALEVTITGGNESMYDYYVNQTTPLAIGDTVYGDPATGADAYFTAGSAYNTSGGDQITAIPSLANPDTITLNTNGGDVTFLGDYGNFTQRDSDLSFQQVKYKLTPTSNIPAGSSFSFSFEGNNSAAQLALVPEPSGALLSLLGLSALGFMRKRRA